MDFGKKIGRGVEPAPIEMPAFAPPPLPGFVPDFTPVPVRLPAAAPSRQFP